MHIESYYDVITESISVIVIEVDERGRAFKTLFTEDERAAAINEHGQIAIRYGWDDDSHLQRFLDLDHTTILQGIKDGTIAEFAE